MIKHTFNDVSVYLFFNIKLKLLAVFSLVVLVRVRPNKVVDDGRMETVIALLDLVKHVLEKIVDEALVITFGRLCQLSTIRFLKKLLLC